MDTQGFAEYCQTQVERDGGGMTQSTADNYISDVERFADWYHNTSDLVGEPSPDDVRDYTIHLARVRGVSNATIQKYFAAIRKYFYYQQRLDEIEQVAQWVGDQYPKTGSGTPDSFTDDELQTLRDAASTDPRLNSMVAILSTLGCRVTELVSLKTTDIAFIEDLDGDDREQLPDWAEGVVTITRAKRSADIRDDMPIAAYERDAIDRYLDARHEYLPSKNHATQTDWLYPTCHNGTLKHMSTKNVRHLLDGLAEQAGDIDPVDVYPHKFRHTVGTRLGKQGNSAQQIARYLGQANSASAETYVHLDRSDVAAMRGEVDP